jgi:hypothetical protein
MTPLSVGLVHSLAPEDELIDSSAPEDESIEEPFPRQPEGMSMNVSNNVWSNLLMLIPIGLILSTNRFGWVARDYPKSW